MRFVSRPYIFTASLPPSVVATAATSIRKLMHAHNKRAHLWENSKRLHGGLTEMGFKLGHRHAGIGDRRGDPGGPDPGGRDVAGTARSRALCEHGAPARDAGRHLSAALLGLRRTQRRNRSKRSSRCSGPRDRPPAR